jgi:predicted nucleic acid-binding protein
MVRIIDASVAVKWFVDEPDREDALEVLGGLLEKPNAFAVPELFFFELFHVLNRVAGDLNPGQSEILDNVLGLGIPRFSMTGELWETSRPFLKKGLSGYDAVYAALAKMLKGRWLTYDRRTYKKIAGENVCALLGKNK